MIGARAASAAAVALLAFQLAGCSMSAEWWVRKSLERSGYSRPAAQCITTGVFGSLASDQLRRLYEAIVYTTERPDRFNGLEDFLRFLDGRVDARTRDVISYYGANCRSGG